MVVVWSVMSKFNQYEENLKVRDNGIFVKAVFMSKEKEAMMKVEFEEDDDTVIVSKEMKVEVGITRMTLISDGEEKKETKGTRYWKKVWVKCHIYSKWNPMSPSMPLDCMNI